MPILDHARIGDHAPARGATVLVLSGIGETSPNRWTQADPAEYSGGMPPTRITSHSGCLGTPPNSLDYLQAALASSVALVEVDVRLDPQGTLVLSHDPVVGPSPELVTLTQAWDLVVGGGLGFNLDVKERAALGPLASFLTTRGAPAGTLVTGCDREWVTTWRDLRPEVPVLLNVLMGPEPGESAKAWETRTVASALSCGAAGLNADHRVVTHGLLSLAANMGLSLDVWTVNEPLVLRRWLAADVGLTTDRPDLAHALLTQI